jgi:sarcosine oxidase
MANRRYDVVVVGTGVMGAATSWALATKGRSVLALERFQIGHKRGSSHGTSRIFRFSYPDPGYVAMAQESLPLWRSLESETGRSVLVTTGGIDLGKNVGQHVDALAACDARFEVLSSDEARRRWDFAAFADGNEVLFQPDAGIVLAHEAWSAFAEQAQAGGVETRSGVRVIGLEERPDRVVVRTEGEVFEASGVVVTSGAWAKDLLSTAGIALETVPTRETIAYFESEGEGPMPSIVDWGDPSVYALATERPHRIKLGEHHAGPTTDPEEEGAPDEASVARLRRWVERSLPGARPEPLAAETCIYTNTPDEGFVLERHGRIVVGSPCSGHGFKFAPLIGRRLATLASETTG